MFKWKTKRATTETAVEASLSGGVPFIPMETHMKPKKFNFGYKMIQIFNFCISAAHLASALAIPFTLPPTHMHIINLRWPNWLTPHLTLC